MRSKHACETGYSRLCLAIDTAERNISKAAGGIPVKPVSTVPQMRSASFTMDTRPSPSSRSEAVTYSEEAKQARSAFPDIHSLDFRTPADASCLISHGMPKSHGAYPSSARALFNVTRKQLESGLQQVEHRATDF